MDIMGGVLFFLAASLVLYVLFGGADFGAGILELFFRGKNESKERQLVSKAIAPVWEANHVWLILAIVILFMGFPQIYTHITTYLHIPVLLLLVGIVGRGTAFTFRHYDTVTDRYYRVYTKVFAYSSVWSAFFLGVIAGATMVGRINPDAQDFFTAYMAPWLNLFSFSLGLFACCLFALLASVYLIGETTERDVQKFFRKTALTANVAVVIWGAVVFLAAEYSGLPLLDVFFSNPWSAASWGIATLLLPLFWKAILANRSILLPRLAGAGIVTLVLFGWFAVQYPVAFMLEGRGVTFAETAAPEATLRVLLGGLVFGSLFIFPALGYLFKVFKWKVS